MGGETGEATDQARHSVWGLVGRTSEQAAGAELGEAAAKCVGGVRGAACGRGSRGGVQGVRRVRCWRILGRARAGGRLQVVAGCLAEAMRRDWCLRENV